MRQMTLAGLGLALAGAGLLPTEALAQDASGEPSSISTIFVLLIVVIGLIIFFIPTIVAFRRGHPNRWPILLINAVFGGTGLGWFGALIWASNAVHKSETGSQGGESGLNVFVNDPKIVQVEGRLVTRTEMPGVVSPDAQADPVSQLRRLQALFDAGVIDADEHKALRRSLIEQFTKR